MGLKFRRGTNAQKSGSLAFGEPYVNTDLGTLQIGGLTGDITLGASGTGSQGSFAGISGSSLDITGNAKIDGNLRLGGNITIGDQTTDTVNITAALSSSLIPVVTNVADLGSSDKIYRAIYGGNIYGAINATNGVISSSAQIKNYGDFATTGSNTFDGLQHINGAIEIHSGSNPEIRLINTTTGIQYHIQNGDGGNFQIHNGTNEKLLFLFQSASLAEGNQDGYFFGNLSVSKSISSPTITRINTFTGSANTRLTNLENQTGSLATTGSNTLKGNQTIIGTGTGFAAYISTSVNDGTLGLDTTANVNAMYFLKNGEKNFEASYDTTNANGIFRLLPYDNNSFFEIGNPSNSANNNTDYVFVAESTYGNVLLGPGIGNATSYLGGSTPLTDKVQIAGNLYVSGAIKANSFTGSIAATNGVVSGSSQVIDILSSLNSLTSSYAKTNTTNTFTGNQTITGSLYISQDLIVQGSSSIQTISSSRLDIGDNIVQLNVNSPSLRFGGLAIVDSGSAGSSGSFLYDSLQDEFIFVHKGNGINVTSSHFVLGPETYDNLGTETYLTNNTLPKGSGKEHLNDSNITDTGTLITLGSNTVVNGTLVASGTTLVSSSAQVVGILSSLNTYTGSNDTSNTAQNSRLDQLSTASGSAITRLSALEVETINLETFSSSALTRLSALEVETSNLETFSSSALTRLSNLEGKDISITLTGDVTGTGTITDLANVSFTTTIAANSVALGTDTTGDYVASMTAGTGITVGTATGEGSTPVITNTGVTSNVAGNAITVSGATGAVTINHADTSTAANLSATSRTYVTALTFDTYGHVTAYSTGTETVTDTNTVTTNIAGMGVTVSSGTGNSTISIGQAVATSDNVRFNSLGIGGAASGTAGRIDAWGDIVAFSTSDKNFKENISPIPNALEKISRISGNTYDWKVDMKEFHGFEGNDVGVIAQEIEEVLPQLVTTRENGYKAVKYDKLVALLIEGIKEQQTQIHSLTLEIEKLKESKGL